MCALKLSLMKKKSLPINTLGRLQGRPHHANLLRNEPFFLSTTTTFRTATRIIKLRKKSFWQKTVHSMDMVLSCKQNGVHS